MTECPLLVARHLSLSVPSRDGARRVLNDVNFTIEAGEALGLVGESGSGKSMTARAVMRLLMRGADVTGDLSFDGAPIWSMGRQRLGRYWSQEVAMIHQNPRAHINPVRTIGDFLTEGLRAQGEHRAAATSRALVVLRSVGIGDGERRLKQYPHQLSGGLLQRVMICAALLTEPKLLIADEPTTALDVTTQEEVIAILAEQRAQRGLALLFITHDLDLAAAVTDRVGVMYAGTIVESGPAAGLHHHVRHPYTAGLLACRPRIDSHDEVVPIPGRALSAFEVGPGCVFADRCAFVEQRCRDARPLLERCDDGLVACRRADELAGWPAAGIGR
jgi:oligopeptide/dipeptide ABC transporter ATP-binding protein